MKDVVELVFAYLIAGECQVYFNLQNSCSFRFIQIYVSTCSEKEFWHKFMNIKYDASHCLINVVLSNEEERFLCIS